MTPPLSVSAGNAAWMRASGAKTLAVYTARRSVGQVVGEAGLRAWTEPTGVVHQQPQRSGVYRGDDQRGPVRGFGDVAGDGDQPRGVQLRGRCLEVVRAPGVGYDRPAAVEQGRGHRAAEAPGAAGDDRDGRDVFGSSHTRHTDS